MPAAPADASRGWWVGGAEAGQDGGLVGWGLSEMLALVGLTPLLQTILLVALALLFGIYGFGIAAAISRWVDQQLMIEPGLEEPTAP